MLINISAIGQPLWVAHKPIVEQRKISASIAPAFNQQMKDLFKHLLIVFRRFHRITSFKKDIVMILKLDCFKDTFHYIVDSQQMNDNQEILDIRVQTIYNGDKLKEYSQNDIYYALCYLSDIGYIDMHYNQLKNKRVISRISGVTMEGQNFYHGTKDPTRWETVKSLAKSAGKATIEFIGDTIQKCAITATAATTNAIISGSIKL